MLKPSVFFPFAVPAASSMVTSLMVSRSTRLSEKEFFGAFLMVIPWMTESVRSLALKNLGLIFPPEPPRVSHLVVEVSNFDEFLKMIVWNLPESTLTI